MIHSFELVNPDIWIRDERNDNYLACDFFQWLVTCQTRNGREKERKEGEKNIRECKTNGKSIMGHKRRAKWPRAAERQNRDNTVSENTPEGGKD